MDSGIESSARVMGWNCDVMGRNCDVMGRLMLEEDGDFKRGLPGLAMM